MSINVVGILKFMSRINVVKILTFMSRINVHKSCWNFNLYEQDKCHAQQS